jgi:hypothetical protein
MNRPPIRGREPELKAIARRIDALCQGQGGCLLIDGRPGTGKTRLLAEVDEMAQSRNLRVASAACDELDRYVPMLPLLSSLRAGPDLILALGELAIAHALDLDDALELATDLLGCTPSAKVRALVGDAYGNPFSDHGIAAVGRQAQIIQIRACWPVVRSAATSPSKAPGKERRFGEPALLPGLRNGGLGAGTVASGSADDDGHGADGRGFGRRDVD